jgi:hypothetical protein
LHTEPRVAQVFQINVVCRGPVNGGVLPQNNMSQYRLQLDGRADWRTQWEGIYAFVREWLAVDFNGTTPADHVFEFERSTRICLPPSVHEWLRFATASYGLDPHFTFRDCLVVEQLKDYDAVSLLLQGEQDTYWAIESRYLNDDNPPVTVFYLDYDDPQGRFVQEGPWSPTVTSFAFDYFLAYLHSPGGGFRVRTSSSHFNRDALVAEFGPPVVFGHLELFCADGILAAISTFSANWHSGELKVEVQQLTPLNKLPSTIQRLMPDAHVLAGALSSYR